MSPQIPLNVSVAPLFKLTEADRNRLPDNSIIHFFERCGSGIMQGNSRENGLFD